MFKTTAMTMAQAGVDSAHPGRRSDRMASQRTSLVIRGPVRQCAQRLLSVIGICSPNSLWLSSRERRELRFVQTAAPHTTQWQSCGRTTPKSVPPVFPTLLALVFFACRLHDVTRVRACRPCEEPAVKPPPSYHNNKASVPRPRPSPPLTPYQTNLSRYPQFVRLHPPTINHTPSAFLI